MDANLSEQSTRPVVKNKVAAELQFRRHVDIASKEGAGSMRHQGGAHPCRGRSKLGDALAVSNAWAGLLLLLDMQERRFLSMALAARFGATQIAFGVAMRGPDDAIAMNLFRRPSRERCA